MDKKRWKVWGSHLTVLAVAMNMGALLITIILLDKGGFYEANAWMAMGSFSLILKGAILIGMVGLKYAFDFIGDKIKVHKFYYIMFPTVLCVLLGLDFAHDLILMIQGTDPVIEPALNLLCGTTIG